jgi:hypothetical protein
MGKVRDECKSRMRELRKELGPTARVTVVKGAYASKLLYQSKIQVPANADQEIEKTQSVFDRALFGEPGNSGTFYFVNRETAYQHPRDGGLGHVHLRSKLRAEWGALALSLAGQHAAWKDIWIEEMEEVYGSLATADLTRTTCSFELFRGSGRGSEVQRRALDAVGSLPAPRGQVRNQEQVKGEWRTKGDTEGPEGDEWDMEELRDQRIFFNVWFQGDTRLSGRSTLEVEREAVQWLKAGAQTIGNLTTQDGRMMSERQFQDRYPSLAIGTYKEILADMPKVWKETLEEGLHPGAEKTGKAKDTRPGNESTDPGVKGTEGATEMETEGDAATTPKTGGEQGAKDTEKKKGATRKVREAAMGYPGTMGAPRQAQDVTKIGVGGIYDRLVAAMWTVPTTFRVGGDGTRIWREKGLNIERKEEDMRRVYESVRHPAIPRHMSDQAYKVTTCTEYVGARFHRKMEDPRRWCPRCKQEDSVAHKYWRCTEVTKLWGLVGRAWERMSGEKLNWNDEWVAAWGARWRKREEATETGKAMILQAGMCGASKRGNGEKQWTGRKKSGKRKKKHRPCWRAAGKDGQKCSRSYTNRH